VLGSFLHFTAISCSSEFRARDVYAESSRDAPAAHTLPPSTYIYIYISVELFSKFNLEIKYFGLLGKVSVANTKHVLVFETQEGCEHNVLES
jgi:hypothetical protein